jgi:hypothetical protein
LSIKKAIIGQVYYFTVTCTFPKDRDQWIKQIPIAGSSPTALFMFINRLKLDKEHKMKLCRDLECSFKDANGVWIQCRIEMTRRRDTKAQVFRRDQAQRIQTIR